MTAQIAAARAATTPFWRRAIRRVAPADREGVIAWSLVAFAVLFNAWYVYPEAAITVPKVNDGALHVISLQRMVASIRSGQNPTDSWLPNVTTGYPLFHFYQHLPFLPPALFAAAFRGVGIATTYNWTTYLLLCAFPISIYWSMRRFGFPPITGALSALVAPVLATNGLFGFDDVSYVWIGYGLYTQLWAMVLVGPALAQGYRTLRDGGGYFFSVVLIAAVVLSHLVMAYITLVSLCVFVLLRPSGSEVWLRGKRLLLLLALVGVVTSYFLIPVLRDNAYLNRSVFEGQEKYDAFGYEWTLRALLGGRLFDYGRWRVLTVLVGVGVAVCAFRWRDERYRIPVAFGGLWLLMYFGRPTWGVLIGLATLNTDFYLHRLISGVHLGGIMLMGLALAVPWRWAFDRKRILFLAAPAAVTVLVLFPAYQERRDYLNRNEHFLTLSDNAARHEQAEIDGLKARLRSLPPGRVYAGLRANWGNTYRVGEVQMSPLLNSAGFDMIGWLFFPFSVNSDIQALFDERQQEQYNLFDIKYVVGPKDHAFPAFVKPIADFGRHRLYRVDTSGYFDLVGSDVTFTGDRNSFYPSVSKWLTSGLLLARQYPAVTFGSAPAGVTAFSLESSPNVLASMKFVAGPPRGTIASERVEDDLYVANVNVLRTSMLMLKETYVPGWHVYIDGVEKKTVMLMPSYVGVRVEPGAHQVRFEYRPDTYRSVLLAIGLVALPLIALGESKRMRVRRSRSQSATLAGERA